MKNYNYEFVNCVLKQSAGSIDRNNSSVVKEIMGRSEKRLVSNTNIYKNLHKELAGKRYTEEDYNELSSERFGRELALYETLTSILNKRVEELTKQLEKYEYVEVETTERAF